METPAPLINNLLKNLIELFVGKPLPAVIGHIDLSDTVSEHIFKNNIIKAASQARFRGLGNALSTVVYNFPSKSFEFFKEWFFNVCVFGHENHLILMNNALWIIDF